MHSACSGTQYVGTVWGYLLSLRPSVDADVYTSASGQENLPFTCNHNRVDISFNCVRNAAVF